MHTHLPTCAFESWTVASLRDSLLSELRGDNEGTILKMFFYAITRPGWQELQETLQHWRRSLSARRVVAYVGTDHGITDPKALKEMHDDEVDVQVMKTYQGAFHPKVVWLSGATSNSVWIGSNNLTKDGLIRNVEFAVVVKSQEIPQDLMRWADAIADASERLTPELLKSYANERRRYDRRRAKAGVTTFTWSRRVEPDGPARHAIPGGALIVEVMPKETGTDGNQVQIPRKAARAFFGVTEVGASRTIRLKPKGGTESRPLTMTVFPNKTVRLVISDLEYGDRPCVIVFEQQDDQVSYEIVPQNIYPTRYGILLSRCGNRTRKRSRRWGIA